MNENVPDNVNWLVRYARESGQQQQALARYNRTLGWLSEWELNPDEGYFSLWEAILQEDPHDS